MRRGWPRQALASRAVEPVHMAWQPGGTCAPSSPPTPMPQVHARRLRLQRQLRRRQGGCLLRRHGAAGDGPECAARRRRRPRRRHADHSCGRPVQRHGLGRCFRSQGCPDRAAAAERPGHSSLCARQSWWANDGIPAALLLLLGGCSWGQVATCRLRFRPAPPQQCPTLALSLPPLRV